MLLILAKNHVVVFATFLILVASLVLCTLAHKIRTGPTISFTKIGEWGQLGNQLFQLAAVHSIASKTHGTAVFPTHVTGLPVYDLFDIDASIEVRDVSPTRIFKESGVTRYHETISPQATRGEVIDLRGYFQHKKYVTSLPTLRPAYQRIAGAFAGYVGVHVRRGDYLKFTHVFMEIPLSYYHNALAHACREAKTMKVLVCSDDIAWCKTNLRLDPSYDIEYSDGTSATDDFAMLAGCKALVMSNSTFSWWAAQYGRKECVVMPWPWFTPGGLESGSNDVDAFKFPSWTLMHVA